MDLDQQIKRYYGSRKLSPASLERIRSAAPGGPFGITARQKQRGALVAALALIAVGVYLWSPWFRGPGPEESLARRLRQEVVLNHTKHPRPAFETDDLAHLAGRLPDLPFDLKQATGALPPGFRVEGGRRCSLLGQPAAQIHLSRDGRVLGSLYVTAAPVLPAGRTFTAGWQGRYHVRTWEARGLFFALAASVPGDDP